MSWRDLIQGEEEVSLPWFGGRSLWSKDRKWQIKGDLPPEYGWHKFRVSGSRWAEWVSASDPDLSLLESLDPVVGYLAGDWIIPDGSSSTDTIQSVGERVFSITEDLPRFTRIQAGRLLSNQLIYVQQLFPQGSEPDVQIRYEDRGEDTTGIKDVTPALDMCFLWETTQRANREALQARLLEERRRREEEERQAAEARAEAERQAARRAEAETRAREAANNALVRRNLAGRSPEEFEVAARAALAMSGAVLLDCRMTRNDEATVNFRYARQRFQCVVERSTLRILDSGICLNSYETGESGDRRFTLESLPPVIQEAIDGGVLHITRRVW